MFGTIRDESTRLLDADPEPSADYLLELTEEAAAEWAEAGEESPGLPPGLDSWLPSPYLAAVLSTTSPRQLSGHNRVNRLKANQRLATHYQAQVCQDMVAVHETMEALEPHDPHFQFRLASAEIRAALHQTARGANAELRMALDLNDTYSEVREALVRGLLDRRRAGLIIHRTSHLDSETAKAVVSKITEEAPEMTSGEIIARIDELNLTADPEETQKRLDEGLTERRVHPEKNWDGTAHYMGLHLAPERVAVAHRRINRIAKQLKTGSEDRTMDQLRADIYLDLLTGNSPKQKRGQVSEPAQVDIRVPVTTLTGETESPGEIPGWGPVLADAAPSDRRRTRRQPVAGHRHRPRHRPAPRRRLHQTPAHRPPNPPGACATACLQLPRVPQPRRRLRPRPQHPLGRRRAHRRHPPRLLIIYPRGIGTTRSGEEARPLLEQRCN